MIGWILFSQVIISTLTILFTFLLFDKFLSPLWSSGIVLLVALSPHLIITNSYILTETLFCFLLVVFGCLFCLFAKNHRCGQVWLSAPRWEPPWSDQACNFFHSLWMEEGQALFRSHTDRFCIGFFALDRAQHGYARHSNRQTPND